MYLPWVSVEWIKLTSPHTKGFNSGKFGVFTASFCCLLLMIWPFAWMNSNPAVIKVEHSIRKQRKRKKEKKKRSYLCRTVMYICKCLWDFIRYSILYYQYRRCINHLLEALLKKITQVTSGWIQTFFYMWYILSVNLYFSYFSWLHV